MYKETDIFKYVLTGSGAENPSEALISGNWHRSY